MQQREQMLADRRAALLADCEGIFLRLQSADGDAAMALRDDLERGHQQVAEYDRRLANLADDIADYLGQRAEIDQLLANAAMTTGFLALGRLSDARASLEAGDYSLADQIFAELAAMNSGPADQAAGLAYGQGLVAEEEVRWSDAARHYAAAARLNPGVSSLHKARVFACLSGDLTAAFRFGQGLMVLAETSGTVEDRAFAMNQHALTLEAQERYPEAEGILRKALLAGRTKTRESNPDHAKYLANLARVLEAQDRAAEAEALYRKALEITRTTLGEADPDYCARLNGLGAALQAQDRDAEAEQVYVKALDFARRRTGSPHPVHVECLTGLAQLAEKQKRFTEAEDYYRMALKIDRGTIGKTHPDHATRLCGLAEAVRAQRRLPEAEALFRQALEIDRATIGLEHRDYGAGLNNLAGVVEAQGRYAEAEKLYAAALDICRRTLGDLHPGTLKVARNFLAMITAHLPASAHQPSVMALWVAGQQGIPAFRS
jgi:tetratricopeptide (TPR) repeat protein